VVKGAIPDFRVRQGLDQLIHLYTLAGFPNEELHTISSRILTQHQNLQSHEQKMPYIHRLLIISGVCFLWFRFLLLSPSVPFPAWLKLALPFLVLLAA